MSFTADEIDYLRAQPLARIATVSADGQPDVVPVTYEFDGTAFLIGGWSPAKTRRHGNVRAGNLKVALVVDDLAPGRRWAPRMLRVYGTAELIATEGRGGPTEVMRITPLISWSFNLASAGEVGDPANDGPRRTVHRPAAAGEATA